MTEETEDKKKRSSKLPQFVSAEEYVELLELDIKHHFKVAFMFAFECGMRISEVFNLKANDVYEEDQRIFVRGGKGDKDRWVPLPLSWQSFHKKYLPLSQFCVMRTYQKGFEDAAIATGLMERKPGIHFHNLRHGFATRQHKQGINIKHTQMLLGHKDISTTMVYTHISPDEALKAHRDNFA